MKSSRKNQSAIPDTGPVNWGLLEHSVGHLVRRVHQKSQVAYADALAPLDLTSFQFGILELAALNRFLTQRRLADLILVDPSVIVGAVDELENRTLILRRRSEEDRRAFILETTPQGLEMLTAARAARAAAEDLLTAGLSSSQRQQLLRALHRLGDIES